MTIARCRLRGHRNHARINIAEAMSDPQLLGAGLGDLTTWSPWLAIR